MEVAKMKRRVLGSVGSVEFLLVNSCISFNHSAISAVMMCQSFSGRSVFTSVVIACVFLGFTSPFGPRMVLAGEGAAVADEPNQAEGHTNDLQKILQKQETLLNTVNQMRSETES